MKKQLFSILVMSVATGVYAQNIYTVTGKPVQKVPAAIANQSLPVLPASDPDAPTFQTYVNKLKTNNRSGNRAYTETVIGNSIYDLQTNASICNRVIVNADGTIGATWIMAHGSDPTSTPDRGTGYNYFDGSNWAVSGANLLTMTRPESDRVGWCNLGVTKTGGEVIVTHEASTGSGNIYVLTRPTKGTGTWTETKLGITDTWPRMVIGGANGNTVHLISQTSGATPVKPPFLGQDGALAYSRSLDGGVTWDKLHTVIPQIDSSSYLGFGGDNYAIDAKGDTIVIVIGGKDMDVAIIKSTDNGNTWVKTIVKKFPITKYDSSKEITDTIPKDGIVDTIESNDGSVAVMLDNAGKAHVWYGRSRVYCSQPGTADPAGLYYLTLTDGLMYWNENMGSAQPKMIAAVQDINGDNILNVTAIGTYYVSLCSMPSAGIDDQGKIYVSYAGVYEGVSDDGTVAGNKSYRHTYVMRSDDGGTTWCEQHDITDPEGPMHQDYWEGVFGAMGKRVTTDVHLVYQRDQATGHGLTANTPDPQTGNEAEMVYVKIPTADLVCGVGIKEQTNADSKVTLYPNPAKENVTITFTVAKATKAEVVIYNAIGQKTAEFANDLSIAGTHNLTINTANYQSGIYFVNAIIDGKSVSKKLVIE